MATAKCPKCRGALVKRWRTRVGYFGGMPAAVPIVVCESCGIVVQIRAIPLARKPSPAKRIGLYETKADALKAAKVEAKRRHVDWNLRNG